MLTISWKGFRKVYEIIYLLIGFPLFVLFVILGRFAITFHQSLRNKSMKTSILDGVKGLGAKRRELINRAYPDINLLKED